MSRSSLTEQGDITKNCISTDIHYLSLAFKATNFKEDLTRTVGINHDIFHRKLLSVKDMRGGAC